MFPEIKKSVLGELEDRISSPFYGSLAISWVLWNWRAIYTTFFVSQEYIKPLTKVQYITNMYSSNGSIVLLLYIGPLVSAVLLITVIPRATNELFKISLKFEKKRIEMREAQTMSRLLSLEKSQEIRRDMTELRDQYEKEITSKNGDISAWKNQAETLNNERQKFKILYAEYGTTTKFNIVTQPMQNILFGNKQLVVNNSTFNIDPALGEYKRLLVVYSVKGNIETITAKEHEQIGFEDNGNGDKLVATETTESKKVYEHLISNTVIPSLETLFPGTWQLDYILNGTPGVEQFEVRDSDKYYWRLNDTVDFEYIFKLEHIQANLEQKKISFYKRGVGEDQRYIFNDLDIVEIGRKYKGTESDGETPVTYTRIDH